MIQKSEKITPFIERVQMQQTLTLVIEKSLQNKIDYLCNKFHEIEWSGVLFYKEGKDEITAVDFYLLNIGSHAFTEFEYTGSLAGYIATNPQLLDCQQGLCHSHNNMQAFFSGTDTETLLEMTDFSKRYLSLIVNNKGQYVASLGVKRKLIQNIQEEYEYINAEFALKKGKENKQIEKTVVCIYPCEIKIMRELDEQFLKNIAEIELEFEKKKLERAKSVENAMRTEAYGSMEQQRASLLQKSLFENDFPFQKFPEKKEESLEQQALELVKTIVSLDYNTKISDPLPNILKEVKGYIKQEKVDVTTLPEIVANSMFDIIEDLFPLTEEPELEKIIIKALELTQEYMYLDPFLMHVTSEALKEYKEYLYLDYDEYKR